RVEEELLGEDDQRALSHRPAPLIATTRVAGRRDHRAKRRVSQEERDRYDGILADDVALVLRLAGELGGRQVDVLLIQLDRDLTLRITEVSKREVARAVPFVGVENHATADRAEHVVEVLQGV